MVNEHNNLQETEHIEVGRLIGTLGRVQAPKDFDFHVRARIAKGRPAEKRASWLPASVRYAAPLALLLGVGGYVGFTTMYSPEQANVTNVVVPADTVAQPVIAAVDPTVNPTVVNPVPSDQALADVKPLDSGNKILKTFQKTPSMANSKTDKPDGGSYDIGGSGERTIIQPDVDDNEPVSPSRKVIVPTNQFLSSAGVNSSGGKIISVSGAAASAGLKAGDQIVSVSVQSGTIRVNRDGKTITVTIK